MKTIFALLVLMLVVVACSNDSETAGTQESKATNKVENDAGSSGSAEFLKLLSQKMNMEYKVSYDLSTTAGGEKQQMKMTQYLDTEKKIRMDSTVENIETRTYMVDGTFTTCSKQSGTWACYKIDSPKEETTVKYDEQITENPSDYNIISDGTKQVAGVTASCFKLSQKTEGFSYRYCFKDGVPLYVYVKTNDAESEMIATSYSKSVSDSDFVPPAKAQDLGAMIPSAAGTVPAGDQNSDVCSYCNMLSGDEKAECLKAC